MWRDAATLLDLLNAGMEIETILGDITYESFVGNREKVLAIERLFSIMGEAANRVSPELKDAHPEIPWGQMIGMRNIMVHRYDKIRQEIVWDNCKHILPGVLDKIEDLIPPSSDFQ